MKNVSTVLIFLIAFYGFSSLGQHEIIKAPIAKIVCDSINPIRVDTIMCKQVIVVPTKEATTDTNSHSMTHDTFAAIGAFLSSLIWQVLRFFFPEKFLEIKRKKLINK